MEYFFLSRCVQTDLEQPLIYVKFVDEIGHLIITTTEEAEGHFVQ